jgi:glycosyltransferase involved in cell wall biosynthesis
MTRRHIAFVSTSYPACEGDAAGHFVQSEARALAARGQRVTVLAPGPAADDPNIRVLSLGGGGAFGWPGALFRVRRNPARALGALLFCARARHTLAALRPDEVVAHFILPSLFPISGSVQCPVTAVAHGSDVALFRRLPRAVRYRLAARFLAQDVRFRCVSKRLERELIAALGPYGRALAARSTVLPCSIDVGRVPDRQSARRILGLDDRFLAVTSSRLVPGKRIDWALQHAPVPEGARWVVLGDGPELARLQRAFPDAQFLGRVDRGVALTWLAAADVVVACSEREGAPSVIREARLLGTPVWTNAVGDVIEWAASDPGIRVLSELTPG